MKRADYMTAAQKAAIDPKMPRTHANMIRVTSKVNGKGEVVSPGVARPGKTAQDRARSKK